MIVGGFGDDADPKLVDYLLANRGEARFLVAALNAGSASRSSSPPASR